MNKSGLRMDKKGTHSMIKTKFHIDQGILHGGYEDTVLDLLWGDNFLQLSVLSDRNLRPWLSSAAVMVPARQHHRESTEWRRNK